MSVNHPPTGEEPLSIGSRASERRPLGDTPGVVERPGSAVMTRAFSQGRADSRTYGRALARIDSEVLATWVGHSRLFQLLFRQYARAFGFPDLGGHLRRRAVAESLAAAPAPVLLDLGAGNALHSISDALLRVRGHRLVADLSPRHVRRAVRTSRSLGLRLSGFVCNGAALPLASESVDVVLVIEVLQFVDDDVGMIHEIARVLRPGGFWLCEQELERFATNPVPTQDHLLTKRRRGYSAKGLAAVASEGGLVLESCRPVLGLRGRQWEKLESWACRQGQFVHLLLFPLLRLLARPAQTSDYDIATMIFRFVKPAVGAIAMAQQPFS